MNVRRLVPRRSRPTTQRYEEVLAACADLVAGKRAYDAAVKAQIDASEQRDAAKQRRDLAVWRLACEENEPVRPLATEIKKSLRQRYTDEEIRWCGLSYANVRLILARPLDQKPLPE